MYLDMSESTKTSYWTGNKTSKRCELNANAYFSGLKYTYLGYCKMKPDQGKGILNNTYDDI